MQRAARIGSAGRPFKTAKLVGHQTGAIRSLPGFKRGFHREPDEQSGGADAWVRQLGAALVTQQLDLLFKGLRSQLGYKRSQLQYADDTGAASITTPDFAVHLWIEQNRAAALEYRLTTEISSFRRPEAIGEARFQQLFDPYVDTVVMDLLTELDVEKTIIALEEAENLGGALEDEPDGSAFKLVLNDLPVELAVTKASVTLKLTRGRGLQGLITQSTAALAHVAPALGLGTSP